jgi:hypothetical protein
MKENISDTRSNNIDLGKGIKFCLNCDEMEDLAVDEEAGSKEAAQKRYQNCQKTGRFEGDICSRVFVADNENFSEEQFTDPKEE